MLEFGQIFGPRARTEQCVGDFKVPLAQAIQSLSLPPIEGYPP